MSFLLKTVLGIAAIEAALLLLLVVGSNSALEASLNSELEKRSKTTLALLDATARDAILSSDLATLESFAKQTIEIPDVAYLTIRGIDGSILAQAATPGVQPQVGGQHNHDLSDANSIRPSSRVVEVEGTAYATIEMGLSTAQAVAATNSLRDRNFLIAMSEMLLVALFSFLLGRYLTSQLKKLDDASTSIAAGNLGMQIPVQGHDELANTLRSFNKMSLELLAAQKKQAASEVRLEALLVGMSNGVALLSHDLGVRYLNPRGQTLLDYLNPTWQETGQVLQLASLDVLGAISNNLLEETLEVHNRGTTRYFSIHLAPVGSKPDGHFDWILTIRDITTSRSRDEHNRRRERLAVVGRLAAGIAHDFNNILGVIIGLAELNLSRLDGIDRELRSDLETILEQAQRSSGLVRQILDFSRSDDGTATAIEINKSLASTTSMLSRTIPNFVTLRFNPPADEELFALFDTSKLEQVIANLVINAVDAMPTGGDITLTADLAEGVLVRPGASDSVPERWICIRITDNGQGIPRNNLVDVFEPFFTTKADSMGTGLGLAQVYGIMQQHGGDISVESQVGLGTTFTLFLRPSTATALKISKKPRLLTRRSSTTSARPTILVVEDEKALRRTIRAMLEEVGYHVVTASTGLEGLEAYMRHKSKLSLIVTDAVMPKMSGIELTQKIRADGGNLPIIMMSGYFQHEGVDLKALEGNLDGFLEKPISISKLAETVSEVLASAHSRSESVD